MMADKADGGGCVDLTEMVKPGLLQSEEEGEVPSMKARIPKKKSKKTKKKKSKKADKPTKKQVYFAEDSEDDFAASNDE